MVMPCSRSARRPSVTSDEVEPLLPTPLRRRGHRVDLVVEQALGVVEQAADQRALAVVDRADGGEAQQLRGSRPPRSSEVALALAVLHRRLGEAIVGSGRAPLGDAAGRDLDDDLGRRCWHSTRRHRCSSCRRRCGSARCAPRPLAGRGLAPTRSPRGTCRRARRPRARGRSRSTAGRAVALDVAPHVELGPVADREGPHVLARPHPAVVEVPQLGPLVARIPLPEVVAERQHALLRPGLVLVAAGAAEAGVEPVLGDGVEER